MTFQRSEDYALIRRLITESRCWHRMKNDAAPSVEDFIVGPGPMYVLAMADGLVCGVFLLVAGAPGYAEVHFCIAPHCWGESWAIGRQFIDWVWTFTNLNVLTGNVPDYNSLALKMAKACGFEVFGRRSCAGWKNGKPFGHLILKLERPTAGRQEKNNASLQLI